jgi:hypothetical protein
VQINANTNQVGQEIKDDQLQVFWQLADDIFLIFIIFL